MIARKLLTFFLAAGLLAALGLGFLPGSGRC